MYEISVDRYKKVRCRINEVERGLGMIRVWNLLPQQVLSIVGVTVGNLDTLTCSH